MSEQIVLFAEEDVQWRMLETAINGEPTPKVLDALRYFFGEDIKPHLDYLVSIPKLVGLPPSFRGVVCDKEDKLPTLISNADYLIVERVKINYDLLKYGQGRLKFIQKHGGDYSNIDIEAAKKLGISVGYFRRISTIFIAEHILALIFALSRNLIFAHETAKNRINAVDGLSSQGPPRTKFNWGKVPKIQLVQGKTLGLVGFGENAFEVAKAAYNAGMKITYYQRHRAMTEWEKTVEARYIPSLKEIVHEADFTSIHVPYYSATEKMINLEILSCMKPTSFLINSSRGGIVDEQALYEVLNGNKIAGAALDVYRWEPIPSDCPLLKLGNVIWTTHNAAGSNDIIHQENVEVLAHIAKVARGEKPDHILV